MADPLIQVGNNAATAVQNPYAAVGTDPNADQFNAALANGTATPSSTTPTVMQPNQAFNNTPIPVPTPTSPDPSEGLVAGAQQTSKSLQDYITELTPPPTTLDTQNQGILDSIATLTGQDTGKAQAQIDAENTSGATQDAKDLKDLNNRLLIANANYEKQFASLEVQPGVSTAIANAQQAGLRRAQAADIGLITAQIQAKQGDLTLAQSTANRAVDAKYSVIEDQLKVKLAQLQAIAPQLDKEQKTQSLALERKYNEEQQRLAEEKAQAKDNVNLALTAGITTKFVNKNGQFFDAATGQPFSNPQDFFKAAGVSSFDQAYKQGLVTDYSMDKIDEKNFVAQLAAKYPDAGIKLSDSQDAAQSKLGNSRIYKKDTYIAPPAGSGGGGLYIPGTDVSVDSAIKNILNGNATIANYNYMSKSQRDAISQGLTQNSTIVDSTMDQQVRAIIAANPGEYGNAANAIDKAFGKGTATKYDTQLKDVYLNKKNVGEAFNSDSYSPLAGSRFALEATRIAKNYVDLPAYVAASQAQVYLPRIAAAAQNPGSVGDAELLDSIVKLNTGGNAITNEQVNLITGYGSYADKLNRFQNQIKKKGGALSDQQRTELVQIAKETNDKYQKAYQPIYNQVTKQLTQAGVPKAFWTIPDLNSLTNQGNQPSQMILNGKILNLQSDGTYE